MSNSYYTGSSSTAGTILVGPSSTAGAISFPYEKRTKKSLRKGKNRQEQKIDAAVYGYIRAIRALDRTKVDTSQISDALNLPYNVVNESIRRLIKNGIKINRIC